MSCRQQFFCTRKNWFYDDAYSNSFTQLQWTKSLKISIIWRVVFFLWWVVNFIRAWIKRFPIGLPNSYFPLVYLTRWVELALNLYALVSLSAVATALIKNRDQEKANFLEKFSGFLAEICMTTNLVVTVLYYFGTGNGWQMDIVSPWSYDALYIHFLNSIIMFFDLWMIKSQFKFYHFWTISVFFSCYATVNAIVWATDNNIVPYKRLNWGTETAFTVGVAIAVIFVASPIIHGIMCLVVRLREWLADKCGKKDGNDEMV